MRKTYAYNSIIIGVLVGILAYTSTESAILGIGACLGVSIVGFIVIRLLENAISRGVDHADDRAAEAWENHKNKKKNG